MEWACALPLPACGERAGVRGRVERRADVASWLEQEIEDHVQNAGQIVEDIGIGKSDNAVALPVQERRARRHPA